MHTCSAYDFHFPCLLCYQASKKERVIYGDNSLPHICDLEDLILRFLSQTEITPYTYKVCAAQKKNESPFPMCMSVQTKYPSSSPCDMRDELDLQHLGGLFFLAQEGTAPSLSGHPRPQGLFKRPA